jgi:hypothetical protein
MTVLQLSNTANWFLSYPPTQTVASQPTPGRFNSIPEITIPILFHNHIIAVLIQSETAQPNWHYAGLLNQKLQLGLSLGQSNGQPETDAVEARRLYLNKTKLLRFEDLSSTFGLTFLPAKWLGDVRITIWEYTGPVPENQYEQIERVEQKIDFIQNSVSPP